LFKFAVVFAVLHSSIIQLRKYSISWVKNSFKGPMPFASEQQRKYLYAKKPEVAQQLAKHNSSKDGKMKKGYKTK